jgi:hypothetical protein
VCGRDRCIRANAADDHADRDRDDLDRDDLDDEFAAA